MTQAVLRRVYSRLRPVRRAAQRIYMAVKGTRSFAARGRAWALFESEPVVSRILVPVNIVLCGLMRWRAIRRSVVHISYMVHVPHHTVVHLRRQGMRADYLGIGASPYWEKCDYNFRASPVPLYRLLQEFWMFWRVVARYEIVHAHFMIMLTQSGWELPLLKRMGRHLVVHFRGCEARDRARNMALHPEINICQECDHHPHICETDSARIRRERAHQYGDAILVTTPDMLDFVPEASHFPFFAPPAEALPPMQVRVAREPREFTIVHVSNQPGIEGTREIEQAIERLQAKGRRLRFEWVHDLTHENAMAVLQQADLAIGKMKMGYYANAQIEAMTLGVPTITYVRPEFMTEELRQSGFIFATLPTLEGTIEYYLDHPDELAAKRQIARESVLRMHDNDRLARRLADFYRELSKGTPATVAARALTA
jgi:hypothetical protein